MDKVIKLADGSFPGNRWALFGVVLVGLFLFKSLRFDDVRIWGTGLAGVISLTLMWLSSLMSQKTSTRFFKSMWWLGVVLLLLGKAMEWFIEMPEP